MPLLSLPASKHWQALYDPLYNHLIHHKEQMLLLSTYILQSNGNRVSSIRSRLSLLVSLCHLLSPDSKRKRVTASARPKTFFKTVICLPPVKKILEPVPIARGEQRAHLQEVGLVGKVCLNSTWKAHEVESEIGSLFAPSFGLYKDDPFPFVYLR